jgi:hypothetical protein
MKNQKLFELLEPNLSFTDFKSEIQEMQFPVLWNRHYYYSLYGQYCEYFRDKQETYLKERETEYLKGIPGLGMEREFENAVKELCDKMEKNKQRIG